MAKPSQSDDDTEESAPKSKKKLIIIIAVVVLLVVGGAAAWFLTKDKGGDAEGKADAPKAESKEEPKFISLDSFTVNLQREEGAEADQYLQINVSLKILDSGLEDKVKAVLPEIRSKINLLLSSKRASEIVTIVGKKKLALDIATEANNVLGFHNEHTPAASHVVAADAAAPGEEAAVAAPVAEVPAGEEAVAAPPAEPGAEAQAQTPPPAKAEKKGVVDVLFTSFLIQ